MSRVLTSASGPVSHQAMYTKLRPRPNGPGRIEVARNQRLRVYGAMIEAVTTHGYAGTTVTELIALAGISRRTFYEQFDNKEACFLRTYDLVVERTVTHVAKAWRADGDWMTKLRRCFDVFAQDVVERPKAARLAAVEALGAGPAAVERVEQTSLTFERMIASSFDRAPDGVTIFPIAVKGIVGGISRVVRKRLLEDDVQRLPEQIDELFDWVLEYRSLACFDLPVAARTPRVRGARPGHALVGQARPGQAHAGQPRGSGIRVRRGDYGGESQERARILRAAAKVAARTGHAQLTVGQIAQQAGVCEEEFIAHFENSGECFLAAVDLLAGDALALAVDASLEGEDAYQSLYLGIAALMRHIADDPTFARVAFVEVFGPGSAGFDRRARLMHAFTELFAAHASSSHEIPEVVVEAIVGAVWQIGHHYVVRDVAYRLPGLVGHIVYLILTPLIGAEAAVQSILASERALLDGGEAERRLSGPAYCISGGLAA
jgi:AcrR family transcriptional regulator